MAGLKVKSTKLCFYHGRRYRPGTVFELPEGVKPSRDMTVVSEGVQAPKPKSKEPESFSDINKVDSEAVKPKGLDVGPKAK